MELLRLIDATEVYKYVIIETGYTSRLILKDLFLIQTADDTFEYPKLVMIKDALWGTRNGRSFKSYIFKNDDSETFNVNDDNLAHVVSEDDVTACTAIVESLNLDGIIAFKNFSMGDCFKTIDYLQQEEYCAHCNASNIVNMCEYNGKVLVIHMDCSSG